LHTSQLAFTKPIATATAIYPVTDLIQWSEEPTSNAVLESKRRVSLLVQQDWTLARSLSLLEKKFSDATRYFIVSGDQDPVVDVQQTLKLCENLKNSQVRYECLILRSESHGFDFNLNTWATRSFIYRWSEFIKN